MEARAGIYERAVRPLLFSLAPDTAHAVAFAALGAVEHFATLRAWVTAALFPPPDERLVVRAMGLEFPHPLGLAAGFDKNCRRPRALAALGFAHLEIGTVTAHPQAANQTPNLFRLPADRALVNRLGFPNVGAELVAARLGAARRRAHGGLRVPVGVSIGKSRRTAANDLEAVIVDYSAALDAVRHAADFVVVNVSSPNTAGLRSLQGSEHARALLARLASRTDGRPLLVKIAPDMGDAELEALLAVVEELALAGVVATNTTLERSGLATSADRICAVGAGGLSGPPLRERALQVVRRVRARLGGATTIVGVGGIEGPEDAIAFVQAGANLLQMYTGFIYGGPQEPRRIAQGLAEWVTRERAQTIGQLVGCAALHS